jgi:Skp family chaperone for outer membrane proteins
MHANVSSQKGEMKGDDAKIKSMGENTFDIYSIVTEKDKSIELAVAIDLGGAFLSSSQHSDKAKIISTLVLDFAIKTTKEGIGKIIKKEKKIQEALNKEFSDLEAQKIKLEKNIENWEKDIEQSKKDILQNEQDQKLKQKEISEQDKIVDDIKAKQKAVK